MRLPNNKFSMILVEMATMPVRAKMLLRMPTVKVLIIVPTMAYRKMAPTESKA